MPYFQINEKCNGCLSCVQNCPANALDYLDQGEKRKLLHNMTRCALCGNCWRICPEGAVEFQHLLNGDWDDVATMDLVRCGVCGESLYTVDFGKTLAEKLDQPEISHLCSKHRKDVALVAWKHLARSGNKVKETVK